PASTYARTSHWPIRRPSRKACNAVHLQSLPHRKEISMARAKMARDSRTPQYPGSTRRPEANQGPEIEREGATPADRADWFYKSRSDQHGKVLSGLWARAAKHRRRLEVEIKGRTAGQPGPVGSVNWTPI